MNKEKAFKIWWDAASTEEANLRQWVSGRKHERSEIRKELMRLAGVEYCAGNDEEAAKFRHLANVTFPEHE